MGTDGQLRLHCRQCSHRLVAAFPLSAYHVTQKPPSGSKLHQPLPFALHTKVPAQQRGLPRFISRLFVPAAFPAPCCLWHNASGLHWTSLCIGNRGYAGLAPTHGACSAGYADKDLMVDCTEMGLKVQPHSSPAVIERVFDYSIDRSRPVDTFR